MQGTEVEQSRAIFAFPDIVSDVDNMQLLLLDVELDYTSTPCQQERW